MHDLINSVWRDWLIGIRLGVLTEFIFDAREPFPEYWLWSGVKRRK
jgi:hypothetical protein